MALSFKHAETDRLAREVAKLTGESLTEAVRTALAKRLEGAHGVALPPGCFRSSFHHPGRIFRCRSDFSSEFSSACAAFRKTLHAFSPQHADFAASISRNFRDAGGPAPSLLHAVRLAPAMRQAAPRSGDLPVSCIYS